jgi:hypothetical protein
VDCRSYLRRVKISSKIYLSILLILVVSVLIGCEKEITIDLPSVESKIVVQGNIEQGQPPIVLLSESQGYFEATDLSSLEDFYLKGATVKVSNGEVEIELEEICTSDIPEELLPLVASLTGFDPEVLAFLDICAYVSFDESIWGEVGGIYDLTVEHEGRLATSTTKINELVHLDSTWFDLSGNSDSLGFAWGILSDPDTLGNAYRWFAQRINHYPEWSENAGEQKDGNYIAPLGSAFDDEFFNGLSFEFAYYRGATLNSDKEDDQNEEVFFFKVGDTIAVKGAVIDRGAFNFVASYETQVSNQGSPFAVPTNVRTNIEGGLGGWIGYGTSYDTIVCVP